MPLGHPPPRVKRALRVEVGNMLVDSHHHLWNLSEVNYPWLMEKGATRFFGDPTTIQQNYLLDEHISKLKPFKFNASVHASRSREQRLKEPGPIIRSTAARSQLLLVTPRGQLS